MWCNDISHKILWWKWGHNLLRQMQWRCAAHFTYLSYWHCQYHPKTNGHHISQASHFSLWYIRPNSTVPLAHKIPYVKYIYVFIWFWPLQTTNWTHIYIDPWEQEPMCEPRKLQFICVTCWRLFIGTLQRFIICHVIGMIIWQTSRLRFNISSPLHCKCKYFTL